VKDRIVLIGPPASGKGTQAALLSATFGIPSVSTGALLRREREQGSELGAEADRYASRGMLFPDELALRAVDQWMDGHARFILDGFPRTVNQATKFDAILNDREIPLDVVYYFELSEEEIRNRITTRLTCSSCGAVYNEQFHRVTLETRCPKCHGRLVRRNDDTQEVMDKRLTQYHEHTAPVVDYYRTEGILRDIDVSAGRDQVFKTLYDDMREAA
jgi:adenylate kinase